MFLEAVEVATFLVENGGVEDVERLVGLDSVGDDLLGEARFAGVEPEVEAAQHVEHDVGDFLERRCIAGKHAVVVAVADNAIGVAGDARLLEALVQE